jgi:hypothetical protein
LHGDKIEEILPSIDESGFFKSLRIRFLTLRRSFLRQNLLQQRSRGEMNFKNQDEHHVGAASTELVSQGYQISPINIKL